MTTRLEQQAAEIAEARAHFIQHMNPNDPAAMTPEKQHYYSVFEQSEIDGVPDEVQRKAILKGAQLAEERNPRT